MNELETRIVKLISDKQAIEADDILSKEVKIQLITAINNELKEYDKRIKRNSQDERMEKAHRIADEAQKAKESYEVGKSINEIFEKKLSKLKELNDPVVNEGLAFREQMVASHSDDMSVAQEYQNYVDTQYRKYFREDALKLEKETSDIQTKYETANGLNDSEPDNQSTTGEIPKTDEEGANFVSEVIKAKDAAANDKQTQLNDDSKDTDNAKAVASIIAEGSKVRPVYADPNNIKSGEKTENASDNLETSSGIDATVEVSEQETVEPENESKQTTSDNVEMSVTGGKVRQTVSKIKGALAGKDNALLGKIKLSAGLAIAALVAIPVVAPIVANVGALTAAGLAVDGYYNFNKGRKGLK